MTDQPGREPEQRLPVPRPPAQPAPADRFTAAPALHSFELTPERAAGIVRQSASARWIGFLAVCVVVLFVVIYYFYELGLPGGLSQSRQTSEANAQLVTSVERGYDLYQANCAQCHGVNGQGFANQAGAPPLHDQQKLFQHLNENYIRTVLTVGGRYVCGNANSAMPIWSNEGSPPGPLNYDQINDIIAFLRAPSSQTFVVRDPGTSEPVKNPDGTDKTFQGWRDTSYKPAANATPFPACWTNAFTGSGSSASPAASGAAGSPAASGSPSASGSGGPTGAQQLKLTAQNIAYTETTLEAAAGSPIALAFDNEDAGIPHNVVIHQGDVNGTAVFTGAIFPGVATQTYNVPALTAGTYVYQCEVHPNMQGTLTVK